ncbi:MAG TPA: adenylate/guanylate cyclase domain-containing protein [Spirochaetia bacterium]|nr:adenylate/guanylate cyclase domain-containing protein [Spirochaetia bacterium]
MGLESTGALDELVRASSQLSRERRLNGLVSVLVEQAIDVTRSDLAALYMYREESDESRSATLFYRRGSAPVPESLSENTDFVSFVDECGETLVVHSSDDPFFTGALLADRMQSAIVLPLVTPRSNLGFLVLNSVHPDFYNRDKFFFLDSFGKMAGNMFHNARLNDELRARLNEIALLQRYQEGVFSSMTNLLVTTDEAGNIRYFNTEARNRLGLTDDAIDKPIEKIFAKEIARSVFKAVRQAGTENRAILGIEGIFSQDGGSLDFSLNVSPLRTHRGKLEGLTLLFTDQSAERELKEKMNVVVEERRVIKDMFARYLSTEVVDSLMKNPELVKPGGDKKNATVFFGDIRGYTSFSEDKPPEYIIGVLNAYFSEAVEIVIRNKGFIDKFIGDAIMAVWGVPMQSEEMDAVGAVTSALEIQDLIRSSDRTFFKGEASKLQVGIGLHTGPLVAGNLGSIRRLNYSVIGDTVNVAARLEGVAKGGEVIITQDTRDLIGDRFKVKQLAAVKVKGKAEPITIFSVLKVVQ